MKTMIFMFLLLNKTVVPTHQLVDDKKTYHIKIDNEVIEYAYKEEVYNWIKTKKFEYDESIECE